eukprot:TRINITY_DN12737_c0_g1_i1.p1 TRINITY_DN12737_c0_g1~~TRINITY_DN12737_c0_g1_i1.p1  ORF type:complete len:407 (-),score=40.12 TRINITY_DN12737_c0_g1_i1:49-1269(-)
MANLATITGKYVSGSPSRIVDTIRRGLASLGSSPPMTVKMLSRLAWFGLAGVGACYVLGGLRLLRNCIWYRNDSQRVFALKYGQQDILLEPRQLPWACWGVATCWARTLPDLIIVGGAKCATSSLYEYLLQHPNAVGGLNCKESHYFTGRSPLRCDTEWADWLFYRSFFPLQWNRWYSWLTGRGKVVVMDATPTLRLPEVAKRMAAVNKQAKVVIVLRDPVARAFSHYRMCVQHLPDSEPRTFDEAVREEMTTNLYNSLHQQCMAAQSLWPIFRDGDDASAYRYLDQSYIHSGMYADLIPHYVEAFGGMDNVLVLSFDDLTSHPADVVNKVLDFVGLGPFPCTFDEAPQNCGTINANAKTGGGGNGDGGDGRTVELLPETADYIRQFVGESNREVKEKYGIDLASR